ncbi:hypothetical protein HK102_004485 [Quaeritorhiza haematococci]|nr:hypothetical protein HK102_004485 [Quaeritorhiza haematococci]
MPRRRDRDAPPGLPHLKMDDSGSLARSVTQATMARLRSTSPNFRNMTAEERGAHLMSHTTSDDEDTLLGRSHTNKSDGSNGHRDSTLLLQDMLDANRTWARQIEAERPGFFEQSSKGQSPRVLWIGCADSRVPANEVVGLGPGDMFVHRNIANVVPHNDLNLLSVVQYAVDVLKVRHIIVCGHYGCGGVHAALGHKQYGLIDNWLRFIKDVRVENRIQLRNYQEGSQEQFDRMVELNVMKGVFNLVHSTIVQNAWGRGQKIDVHGWVYQLKDGMIRDLHRCIKGPDDIDPVFNMLDEDDH